MVRYNPLGSTGVNKVATIITEELGWIFRPQYVDDVGVDGIIEQVLDNPTGKLIAVQIKAGDSFFKNEKDNNIPFRIETKHFDYWSELCIPVIICLYDPKSKNVYWELFSPKDIKQTGNSYVLTVSKTNVLSNSSIDSLNTIIDYQLKETLINDVDGDNLDYSQIVEMSTLYTEEATELMESMNKAGYNLADKLFQMAGSVSYNIIPGKNPLIHIFNKMKATYNIYATNLKKDIPVFLKLRINSLKYVELSIPHFNNPAVRNIQSLIINFLNELSDSIPIIENMISDIQKGFDAHKNDPIKYPRDVAKAINNKISVEEDYIYTLNEVKHFTSVLLKALPSNIQECLANKSNEEKQS